MPKNVSMVLIGLLFSFSVTAATFGPVENFDVVNDTGLEAHGFEIELQGITDQDISSVFASATRWPGMNRYGAPTIANFPGGVRVTYKATYANGAWNTGTPYGTLPVAPRDSCWPLGAVGQYGPAYPCDHFGVSTFKPATLVKYNWLVETASPGVLAYGVSNVPGPVWTVVPVAPIQPAPIPQPPVNNVPQPPIIPAPIPQPPVVNVVIRAPEPVDAIEFGKAKWVKVTASGSPVNVAVEDLVRDNKVVKDAQLQTQVEWQLLQTDSGNPAAGQIDLTGVKLDANVKAVVYTFEYYQYTGATDPSTGEAFSINGDTAVPDPIDLGNFLVIQMAGVNLDGQVPPLPVAPVGPTINAIFTDASAGVFYSKVVDVTPGVAGDVLDILVSGLPAGLSYNALTNTVEGIATTIGSFVVSITANDVTNGTTISGTVSMNVVDPAIVFTPDLGVSTIGSGYFNMLTATGGTAPFSYALTSGILPAGVTLDIGGQLSGTPSELGAFPVTFTVTDSVGVSVATVGSVFKVDPIAVVACSGTNEVIGNLGRAGWFSTATNRVIYPNQANTILALGMVSFANGDVVTYTGTMDAAGIFCVASTMSVSHPFTVATPVFTVGQVGTAYPAVAITPVGGWAPYNVTVANLPLGLSWDGTSIVGTPTVSGTFVLSIGVIDAQNNAFNITTSSIVVNPAPVVIPPSCTAPAGSRKVEGKGRITAVSATSITVGVKVINFADCTKRELNGGAVGFALGQIAEYKGFDNGGLITATKITID